MLAEADPEAESDWPPLPHLSIREQVIFSGDHDGRRSEREDGPLSLG